VRSCSNSRSHFSNLFDVTVRSPNLILELAFLQSSSGFYRTTRTISEFGGHNVSNRVGQLASWHVGEFGKVSAGLSNELV